MSWYPTRSDDDAASAVTAAFTTAFGRRPEGVWAAPGRVNLIGEHVDYNAGVCLPLALPHRAYAAIARRDDGQLRLHSAQVPGPDGRWQGELADLAPGAVQGWAGYAAGVPWALRADGFDVAGVDVAVDSAVPIGAGLSSSASLECCVAVGLDELFGLGLGGDDAGRRRLAAACVRAENEIAGAPTGGMDQAAVLRCTAGHALLLDCRDFGIEQLALDPAADGLHLLVIDTRTHHALVDGQYGSRRELCAQAARALGVANLRELADTLAEPRVAPVEAPCEPRVAPVEAPSEPRVAQIGGRHGGQDSQFAPLGGVEEALDRLGDGERGRDLRRVSRHVVTEIARVRAATELLRAGRLAELGSLLDASHRSLREDYQVSCAELDLAVEAARAAGASGARMTGGGFGGSAVALVPAQVAQAVADAVTDAFVAGGFTPPRFLSAVPSAAAGRIG